MKDNSIETNKPFSNPIKSHLRLSRFRRLQANSPYKTRQAAYRFSHYAIIISLSMLFLGCLVGGCSDSGTEEIDPNVLFSLTSADTQSTNTSDTTTPEKEFEDCKEPDLVLTQFQAPSSLVAGSMSSVLVSVSNQGVADMTTPVDIDVYLQVEAEDGEGGTTLEITPLKTVVLDELGADENRTLMINFQVPDSALNDPLLMVWIDPPEDVSQLWWEEEDPDMEGEVIECDEINNGCSGDYARPVQITFSDIEAISINAPSQVETNKSTELFITVENTQPAACSNIEFGVKYSADENWDEDDTTDPLIGTATLALLDEFGTATVGIEIGIPDVTTPASAYLLIKADLYTAISETDENNNMLAKAISVVSDPGEDSDCQSIALNSWNFANLSDSDIDCFSINMEPTNDYLLFTSIYSETNNLDFYVYDTCCATPFASVHYEDVAFLKQDYLSDGRMNGAPLTFQWANNASSATSLDFLMVRAPSGGMIMETEPNNSLIFSEGMGTLGTPPAFPIMLVKDGDMSPFVHKEDYYKFYSDDKTSVIIRLLKQGGDDFPELKFIYEETPGDYVVIPPVNVQSSPTALTYFYEGGTPQQVYYINLINHKRVTFDYILYVIGVD